MSAEQPNHLTLPLRTSTDTAGAVKDVLQRLEDAGDDVRILRLVANSEVMFRPFVALSSAIMRRSALPATVREAVILWLAQRRGASYELAEHVRIGRRVGLTDAQIDMVLTGELDERELGDDAVLAVAVARELLDDGQLSRALWDQARQRFGPETTLELVFVIGFFGGLVPLVLGALQLTEADVL